MMNKMKKNKSRKYYRKCGECGKRDEQSNMIRTNLSDNGWLCHECYYNNEYDWYPYMTDEDLGFNA